MALLPAPFGWATNLPVPTEYAAISNFHESARSLTFSRWDDIVGKMHTFRRWAGQGGYVPITGWLC